MSRVARRPTGLVRAVALVGLIAQVAACSDEAPRLAVDVWLTNSDQSALLARQSPLATEPVGGDAQVVIDTSRRFQEIAGFGASITDATTILLNGSLTDEGRTALLAELFGPPPGLGLSFVRLPIGASDFSAEHYSFDDLSAGARDESLARFSLPPITRQALALTREAISINPRLTVMATPWSPPGWMKTSNSLIGGTLNSGDHDVFSTYLLRSIQAFAEEGVELDLLSIQNEPDYEPPDYPGMRLSAAQRAAIIGQHLGPLLDQSGIDIDILEWDHNWDKPEQPLAVLSDTQALAHVAGVAWHCYAGDVSAQSTVRDAFPGGDVYLTECTGGDWDPEWQSSFPWAMQNLIIGATRHWARGVVFWNLALDEAHGPHLGGCDNCRGVVTINSETGAVTRNVEYYVLAHASRFVRPGAHRVASSSTLQPVETVAFQNTDDGSIVLIALNNGAAAVSPVVRRGQTQFRYSIPAKSAATFVWHGG